MAANLIGDHPLLLLLQDHLPLLSPTAILAFGGVIAAAAAAAAVGCPFVCRSKVAASIVNLA